MALNDCRLSILMAVTKSQKGFFLPYFEGENINFGKEEDILPVVFP